MIHFNIQAAGWVTQGRHKGNNVKLLGIFSEFFVCAYRGPSYYSMVNTDIVNLTR